MADLSMTMKVSGMSELARALERDKRGVLKAFERALYASMVHVGNQANQLVPVDTGNLKASQQIHHRGAGTHLEVEITYGGAVQNGAGTGDEADARNYAILQHERDYNHPNGGQKKYLEQPFLEEVGAWPGRLIDRIRVEYHGGGSK